MKYCEKCGTQINEESSFCPSCGANLKPIKSTDNTKADGKAIASMILGIIAVSWAALELLSLGNINEAISYYYSPAAIVGFFIGYNLLSLPCSIIGLSLGIASKRNCGIKTSGIITSIISLTIVLLSLMIIIL